MSLTAVYVLPLFLLALIVFWRRRDRWSAAGLAGASVVALYSDLHFALFCGLIAVAWSAAALLIGRRRDLGIAGGRPASRVLGMGALVVVVVAVASIPVLAGVLYRDPAVFPGEKHRGGKIAAEFSANPWNYVVPPAHTLLWRGFTNDFVGSRLGARTSNEVTAYPGLVTYGLAAAAVILAVAGRRRGSQAPAVSGGETGGKAADGSGSSGGTGRASGGPPAAGWPPERRALLDATVVFCLVCGAAAFILSLPPFYDVGGTRVYTPSAALEFGLPVFRYFCRWAVVVTFSLCLLAAVGVALIQKRLRLKPIVSAGLSLALIALFALDVTIVPPLRARPFNRPPAVLEALARYPAREPVAIYPLAQGYEYASLHYMYFQRFHRHPMLNGIKSATEADLFRLSLKDIYSGYTPRMLAGLGIEKVVVLSRYFENREYGNYPYGVSFDPGKMPDGYRLLEETHDGYIYEVVAEPASVYPLYHSGFTAPGLLGDGRSWAAMVSPVASIELVNRGAGGSFLFSLSAAVPPGAGGALSVELDGRLIARFELQTGPQRIILPSADLASGRHRLTLRYGGRPALIDGTPFRQEAELKVYLAVSDPRVDSLE